MIPAKEADAGTGPQLSGNLRVDFFGFEQMPSSARPVMQQDATPSASRKSPWLAAGLSVIVPGSGEFYAESYWKSALFLAVEVAAWALAYTYDKKGDRQTDSFQEYANGHWSVYQYARYTESHMSPARGPYNWEIPGTEGRPPWERVNWNELNRMESDIGGFYSHNLPPYGEQQYYELIGKYPQFNQGWDDANTELPGDYDVIKANLTPNYQYYSGERGEANNYYDKASTFITVAIVNHVVSAIDAAWSAGSYNKVHAEVGMQRVPVGGYYYAHVPVVKVRYGF
ncbi:hypothetical protein EHM92_04755 [bacterium]|nr:MAG: hypothetical protein EHM92_04755 [bacterium]